MKTTYSLAVALAMLSLLGCDSLIHEVNPDKVPTASAKLVVHSFISPQDTVLAVYVQAPKAIPGAIVNDLNEYMTVSLPNATVELSDGTQTVRLTAVTQSMNRVLITKYYGIRASKFPIMTGRTYTLSVSAPGYPLATAQCTVPAVVKPTEIRVDSAQSNLAQQRGLVYVGRLIWQDPAGQPNYYSVRGANYRRVQGKTSTYPSTILRDTIITYSYPLDFKGALLISDQDKDGQQFVSAKGEGSNSQNCSSNSDKLLAYRIEMTLASVDENYLSLPNSHRPAGKGRREPVCRTSDYS